MPPILPPQHLPPTFLVSTTAGESISTPTSSPSTQQEPIHVDPPNHGTVVFGPYWAAIERIALRTPHLTTNQRQKLFDAYFETESPGGLRQLYTAKSVEHLFLFSQYLSEGETPQTTHVLQKLTDLLDDDASTSRHFHELFNLMEEQPHFPSRDTIVTLLRAGLTAETITSRIIGTRHTAFLKEPSVAHALGSLLATESFYLDPESERRRYSRSVLMEEIGRRVDNHEPLTAEALIEVIERTGFFIPPRIRICIKSGDEFDRKVATWGQVEGCENPNGCRTTIFRRIGDLGEIWVRDLEPSNRVSSIYEWMNRLIALPHETTHALQADYSNRIVSEVLAGLAEQRWRMKFSDIDTWILASRLGMTLVQYLKLAAQWAYHLPRNV